MSGAASTAWRFYVRMLRERTLPTQMATGAMIGFSADIMAQQVIDPQGPHQWSRTARQTFYSSCIFAPVANRAFAALNYIKLQRAWPTAFARTGVDMCTFMPSFTVLYSSGMGLMEGRPIPEIYHRWKTNFPTIVKNQWMVFGPAQLVNMMVLPLYARPPFMALIGLGWTAYLATMNSRSVTAAAPMTEKLEMRLLAAQTE